MIHTQNLIPVSLKILKEAEKRYPNQHKSDYYAYRIRNNKEAGYGQGSCHVYYTVNLAQKITCKTWYALYQQNQNKKNLHSTRQRERKENVSCSKYVYNTINIRD